MADDWTTHALPETAHRRRLASAAAAVVVVVVVLLYWALLAGCGDDSDGDHAAAEAEGETSEPTTTTGPPAASSGPPCQPGTLGQRTYILCGAGGASGQDVDGLVVALHGRGSSAEEMQAGTELHRAAAVEGWAVVYPDAIDGGWGDDTFTTSSRPSGDEDLVFLDDLLAELRSDPRIGVQPVGVVGFSNGASMALRYAAQRPEDVRAVVSVAGQLPRDRAVHPSRPVPLLQIYGADDPVRGYATGIPASPDREPGDPTPTLSTPDTVAAFVEASGAEVRYDGPTDTDPDLSDRTAVQTEAWTREGETLAVMHTIVGGGHTWPSSPAPTDTPLDFGEVSHDIDASAAAVAFIVDPDSYGH